MGFIADIKKENCFLCEEIKNAYYSIESIDVSNKKAHIKVCAYLSREAKKTQKKLMRSTLIEPTHLKVDSTVEQQQQANTISNDIAKSNDIATGTTIKLTPVSTISAPAIIEITIDIDTSLIKDYLESFDITLQKKGLYKDVKRVLGFGNAIDVFETQEEKSENK